MATATEAAAVAGEPPATEMATEVKEVTSGEAMPVEKTAEAGEKAVKAKKARKPRTRKPKSAGPHHPPYFEMIKEAILALDGKSGSSPHAIAKHMGEKHKDVLPPNYRKVLGVQLRNFAAKGKLVKVKASFKLAAGVEQGSKKPLARKKAAGAGAGAAKEAKKPATAAAARPARTKKAKKVAAAPPKPRQRKSVRTAVAKKANKASA